MLALRWIGGGKRPHGAVVNSLTLYSRLFSSPVAQTPNPTSATSDSATPSSTSTSHTTPTATVTSSPNLSCAPLRLGVLGGGISGLTLAYELKRQFQRAPFTPTRPVRITLIEQSKRFGGWVSTSHLPPLPSTSSSSSSSAPSSPTRPLVLENGPRSLLYRPTDAASNSALSLITDLRLGSQVVHADRSARKRFVWNLDNSTTMNVVEAAQNTPRGSLVPLPSGLWSAWKFKYRRELIQGLIHEWKEPPLVGEPAMRDETVMEWTTRRFNKSIAEELIDPLIGGIYAGNPSKLSMQSCLSRLVVSERRSGGVLRDMLTPSAEAKAERERRRLESVQQLDEEIARLAKATSEELDEHEWIHTLRSGGSGGIYSFRQGMDTLTRTLRANLERHDTAQSNVQIELKSETEVSALQINDANKPVLELLDRSATEDGTNMNKPLHEFDHVFTTLPAFALHRLLQSDSTHLPIDRSLHSQLLDCLSGTPHASVTVVHVIFDRDVIPADKKAFGILVPTKHALKDMDILGISFDSCIFPSHHSSPSETRLSVMLGGDRQRQRHRHRHLTMDQVGQQDDDAKLVAVYAIYTMLGLDPDKVQPTLVSVTNNEHCIPQYLTGHAQRTHQLHEILKHLAYTPSSFTLPTPQPLPPIDISIHAAAHHAANHSTSVESSPPLALRPLSLLGTSFYGVSLNDCIHHARTMAKDFVTRLDGRKFKDP